MLVRVRDLVIGVGEELFPSQLRESPLVVCAGSSSRVSDRYIVRCSLRMVSSLLLTGQKRLMNSPTDSTILRC